jgi:hypothetical protein
MAPVPAQADPTEPTTVSHAVCRSAWARLIAKVYEVDPMLCPRCRSEMKLIALDWKAVAADVQPFIERQADLKLLTRETLLRLLEESSWPRDVPKTMK